MYSYAIIGFGGLGKSHLLSMESIAKQRGDLYLKAICGTTKENFNQSVQLNIGNIDMSQVNIDNCAFYDNYKELIVKEEPDFIIITLPTYLHAEVSIFALERGVSVFCENTTALIKEAIGKLKKAGKYIGISLGDNSEATIKYWHDMGIDMISAGTDFDYLTACTKKNKEILEKVHKGV